MTAAVPIGAVGVGSGSSVIRGSPLRTVGDVRPVARRRGHGTLATRRWEDAEMDSRTVALVLAAGAGSRFGGRKLLATIGGRPVLQHVLDALAEAGIEDVGVVLGADAADVEAGIVWRAETRVVNPAPERGLCSSLTSGFAATGSAGQRPGLRGGTGSEPGPFAPGGVWPRGRDRR